ncbi:hypothetical protein BpHYR1_007961 [Brachionus plicatilis]|uniref:Uncharacterized protein n=1 Tax=Brachionus plicatilis TaxID=10195 RepID=A0A3M7RE55_BRAPC|nr:hypothetical protein BpHYR1_007961 [Brachionus plicatilis]
MPLLSFRNKRKEQNSDEKEPVPDNDDEDEDLVDSSNEGTQKSSSEKRHFAERFNQVPFKMNFFVCKSKFSFKSIKIFKPIKGGGPEKTGLKRTA